MTDRLTRIISLNENVYGIACDTTKLVGEACKKHDLGPTAAAALGRALTGAVLLAALLKDDQSVQLIFEGNGPLGKVIAEAKSNGQARGYVVKPHADIPLKNGRIDVAGGIGHAGFLRVIKDIGMEQKYTGLVQLYSSEIGDDIAYYLTESEQTPSAVGLGVHLTTEGEVAAAGGFIIQTLPPADDNIISRIEKQIENLGSFTALLQKGQSPQMIISTIFSDIEHKQTAELNPTFRCRCSLEKMQQVLKTLSRDDLDYLFSEKNELELVCDFCSKRYVQQQEEVRKILRPK